jgi:hypothetical protein
LRGGAPGIQEGLAGEDAAVDLVEDAAEVLAELAAGLQRLLGAGGVDRLMVVICRAKSSGCTCSTPWATFSSLVAVTSQTVVNRVVVSARTSSGAS